MTELQDQRCVNCLFFWGNPNSHGRVEGVCRRYPPSLGIAIMHQGGGIVTPGKQGAPNVDFLYRFPAVTPTEQWCGEWKENI